MTEHYRLSFTTGGLFLQEAPAVAELFLETDDWKATRKRVVDENLLGSRTTASASRVSLEVIGRLEQLSAEELEALLSFSSRDRGYLLWVAACRRYLLIRDFAVEVLHEQFLVRRLQITTGDYDAFWNSKAVWHPELDEVKDSTRERLRTNVFLMLRQAELTTDNLYIQQALPGNQLIELLRQAGGAEFRLLPLYPESVAGGTQ